MGRMNFAPRMPTIIVALVLIVVGMLSTFAGMVPDIAGFTGETIGVWAFLAAGAVLLAGMLIEGI
jgi:hypothetical protein